MKVNVEMDLVDAIEKTFKVTTVEGREIPFKANTIQRAFEEKAGRRNIIMKSRQQGFSTWCIARQLMLCLLKPGTNSVGVFNNRQESEHAFLVAGRMLKNIREDILKMSNGSTYTAYYCFQKSPKVIQKIDNLLISELSRWSNEGFLEDIRQFAAPDYEEVIESTPFGNEGIFKDEWINAGTNGIVRHFFPWWMTEEYRIKGAGENFDRLTLTDEECGLIARNGLSLDQIAFRRMRLKARTGRPDELAAYKESYLEEVLWVEEA